MVKISNILMPTYNKLLPICEKQKITLNLDLPDPTIQITDQKTFQATLKQLTTTAIKRINKNGTLTISAERTAKNTITLSVKDSGESLTREEREALANETTEVKSRMGYGTTITVKFPA